MKKLLLGLSSLLSFVGGVVTIFIAEDRGSPGLALGGLVSIGVATVLIYAYGTLDEMMRVASWNKESGPSATASPPHKTKTGGRKNRHL